MRRALPGMVLGLIVLGMSRGEAQEAAPPGPPAPALSEALRRSGPPSQRPADDPGPPPAEGVFYVPGEYYPDGDTVAWRKGFWSKAQSGWTWLPARWTRQADGWSFDDGRWIRSGAAVAARGRADANVAAGDSAIGPLASGYAPMTSGPGYLWGGGPGYGWGNPYFGGPGFGLYSPPMMWLSGTGFGGYGPVTQYFNPGFALMYPYGMGWGFGGWGGWGWW